MPAVHCKLNHLAPKRLVAKPEMLVRAVALLNHELLLLIVWQTSRTLPHSQCMLARRGPMMVYAGKARA